MPGRTGRVLITGANGFVGRYAVAAFKDAGYTVIGAGFATPGPDAQFDLRDAENVSAAIRAAAPDCVLHLAAQSFVPAAVADPLSTYEVNVLGTARLLRALQEEARPIRLLFVSSAEVYGRQALHTLPLTETAAPIPANPYAASKAAAEIVSLAGRSAQLEVLIARPFNHIGPGQDARFVVAGFAQQLAHIIDGGEPVLAVGNLEAERDFLDVRDVVRAYVALMADGTDGEIYNIAGGRPVAVREILRRLILLANVPVAVQEDEARMRPSEIPRFFGSAQKIRAAVGWEAQISLDASLLAILDAARKLEPAG